MIFSGGHFHLGIFLLSTSLVALVVGGQAGGGLGFLLRVRLLAELLDPVEISKISSAVDYIEMARLGLAYLLRCGFPFR